MKARSYRGVSSWAAAGAVVMALVITRPALGADPEARAGARAAASAGADAFDAGHWQEAVDYFERAQSLVHSPVHLWYLARAQLELGRLVAAREGCLRVQRETLPANASGGLVAAREGCDELLEQVGSRVPTLTLTVKGAPEGTEIVVKRNDDEVPAALLGIPSPTDPGEHVFTAEAPGYFPAEGRITLSEGAKEALTLELRPDPNAQAALEAEAQGPAPAPPSATVADTSSGWGPPPLVSTIAFGVGVAGLAAGTVFALRGASQADEADELCGGSRSSCSLDEGSGAANRVLDLNDQAGTSQTLAYVGFGVGGAAVVTGFVLWMLDGGSQEKATAKPERWTPVVGLGRVGVVGRF